MVPGLICEADPLSACGKARQLGQVFTPAAVADLIASQCIREPQATVFDPCAGEGALLLAAGRRLAALGAAGWHRQVFGLEIDPEAWARGREALARAAGVTPGEIQVVQGDFLTFGARGGDLPLAGSWAGAEDDGPASSGAGPEAVACPEGLQLPAVYDVALMNPPYTRQERVARERKRAGVAAGLSRRTGLFGHFWVHLAEFLREGGWLGAITPATWLSNAFGRGLQRFLLDQFRIHLLIDFERGVFPDACVDACVAILEKRSGAAAAHARAQTPVRFVRLGAGRNLQDALQEALASGAPGEGDGWRVWTGTQAELAGETRWNRFFLSTVGRRVVAAAARIECTAGAPLAALAHIGRGITTGNNRVFLLSAQAARAAGIEETSLRDIVRSPREIPGLDTESIVEPAKLVLPPGPDGEDSRAAAYLRERGVVRSPHIPPVLPEPAPILFGYAVRSRKAFFRNSAALLAGDNFLGITPLRAGDVAFLFAWLNALPTAFLLETLGRGQGRGLLKIQRYELAALRVPDPASLDAGLRRELERLGEALRRNPTDMAVRTELDRVACRVAGVEAADLRAAEQQLREARLARRERM